jgi:glycosyltransferase involved in cell wall biosynthesis
MRILALTRYERLGSSSRVRFYQYFPYLTEHGVQITNAPFFGDTYIQRLYAGQAVNSISVLQAYAKRLLGILGSAKYDLLWIEKELFPWLPAWSELLLQRLGIPYVVDYDDAVFHRYDMHRSAPVRALLSHKIDRVMQYAALVIAGNEYIAGRAAQAGAKRIEHLPSVVDVESYKLGRNAIQSPFQIGWIGSPVTANYLRKVSEALTVLSHETEIHVTLIGSGDIVPFPDIPTTILPWDEQRERSIGEIFDVGIMPLVDEPFERGKCGYKLIQYMAGGIPVVASPIGINRQIVEPQVTGYLAESTADWLTSLRSLRDDPEKRTAMGLAGRQKAEKLYNLQATAPILLDLLMSAAKN